MAETTKARILKKQMVEALEKSLSVVTTAAKSIRPDAWQTLRRRHYEWMETDPEYKATIDSIDGVMLDFAESHLHKRIKEGDTTSIIFLLKTKGRNRGYIERRDMDVTSGGDKISIKPIDWTGGS